MDHSIRRSFPIVYGLMFLYGIQATLLGVVLPELIRRYDTTVGAGGFLVTAQTIGGFLVLGLIVFVFTRVSRPRYMAIAYAIMGIASIITARAPGYHIVALLFVALGAGMRLFDASSNSFVGEFAVSRRNRSMNFLHTCFAAGAIIGPVVAQVLLNTTGSWSAVYLATGIVSVLAAIPLPVVGATTHRDEHDPAEKSAVAADIHAPMGHALADRRLIFASLVLALYAIHQSSLTAWLPLLLETSGSLNTGSGAGISVYWVGILAGRMLATRIPDSADRMLVVAGGALLGSVLTAAAIGTASRTGIVLPLLAAAGASSGALIPLTLSAGHVILHERTSEITAIFSIFLLIGRFVGPWGIGILADFATIRSSLYITSGVLVLCALFAFAARNRPGNDVATEETTHGN